MERIFIDMDGVLADFDAKVMGIATHLTGKDDPHWDAVVDLIEPQDGFYRDLKPVPGAVRAFKLLASRFDVYILSTASWHNPSSWTDKRLWVEEHLGDVAHKRLILSHNKGLFTGRALIDDRSKNGVQEFTGEHIMFGSSKFPDWESVLGYLMSNELNSLNSLINL